MSLATIGIAQAANLVLSSVYVKPVRSVAGILADCVVSERHTDELTITDHPVDIGASISDHAYKNPAVVELVYGFYPKVGGGNLPGTSSGFGLTELLSNFDPTNVFKDSQESLKRIYEYFLTVQKERLIFTVFTGKRIYENMMLQSLGVDTDVTTENNLVVTVTCREVLIARTEVVKFPAADKQKKPAKTASVVNKGTKSLKPAKGYKAGRAGL